MYVLLAGTARVFVSGPEGDIWLRDLRPGDVFGELAIFTRAPRSATVQASGETRVLTLNKRQFLARVHEDPSLAFRILEQMSDNIQRPTDEIVRLNSLVSPAERADGWSLGAPPEAFSGSQANNARGTHVGHSSRFKQT